MLLLRGGTVLVLAVWITVSNAEFTECLNQADPGYEVGFSQAPAPWVYSSAGSLEALYNFARSFLLSVQPYGLPLDVASRISSKEASSSQVVFYEAGYVVCLILAVLYMLIIPIVGAVLAWRYCHSKNEQINSQSGASSSPWYKQNIIVIPCLAIVVILLLTGVILAFRTNSKLHYEMGPNLADLLTNFEVIDVALSSIPQKVEAIVEQFSTFRDELMYELFASGNLIGKTVLSFLSTEISTASHDLDITIQDASGALQNLQTMQRTRLNMQNLYNYLQSQLQQMQTRLQNLNSTLNTSGLQTVANYTLIPSVDITVKQLSYLSEFDGMGQQLQTFILSVPQTCTNQMTPQIEGLLPYFNETEDTLRNYSRRLPSLQSFSDAVTTALTLLYKSEPEIVYIDYVRWSLSVFFCMLILIIVLLMLAALVIGVSMLISPSLYPFHLQDRFRLASVYLLYVAAGIIFVFSWLFIVMVFINLFFGGNAEALVCRSCTSGEIFEYLDKQQHLFSSLNNSNGDPTQTTNSSQVSTYNNMTLNSTSGLPMDIKSIDIYEGCEQGISLFYSMYMYEDFNMDEFLNKSLYLTGFNASMQTLTVNLNTLNLSYINAVQTFKDSSQLGQINYTEFRALMAKPIVNTDLDTFASNLETAAAQSSNSSVRVHLINEAAFARQLAVFVRTQTSYRSTMNASMEALATINQRYKANADNTLQSANDVDASLQSLVPYVVQNVSRCMMERGAVLMEQFLEMVRYAIIDQTLNCSWLPVSLSNIYITACENLIGPWNASWLSLGWCCAFLVPALIFSILIARLWHLSISQTNKELFHMPDDIIDKGISNPAMTMSDIKGQSKMEPPQNAEGNIYQCTEEQNDFKKDNNDTKKKSFNVYTTLDEEMGYDYGKVEKNGRMKGD